jgi:hypothetical protein
MEAAFINNNFLDGLSLKEVMETFFSSNSLDSVKSRFFYVFQCWVTKDCNYKAEISDKEIALFFDQLTNLVAAAYIIHQANRVSITKQEGESHE